MELFDTPNDCPSLSQQRINEDASTSSPAKRIADDASISITEDKVKL
jgi:hypothetical protein